MLCAIIKMVRSVVLSQSSSSQLAVYDLLVCRTKTALYALTCLCFVIRLSAVMTHYHTTVYSAILWHSNKTHSVLCFDDNTSIVFNVSRLAAKLLTSSSDVALFQNNNLINRVCSQVETQAYCQLFSRGGNRLQVCEVLYCFYKKPSSV